ncbi:hypothetical protein DLM76_17265 [Leptospira yasudae]|nr:hypothetical protein DLM76_17265 [Leptospira yasudae]
MVDVAIKDLKKNGLNNLNITPTTGKFKGAYRYKLKKDYRIIFYIDEIKKEITIERIGQREGVYKNR